MGDLFRRYWLPFLIDSELEVDGPPKRVRLYGEDLVAFSHGASPIRRRRRLWRDRPRPPLLWSATFLEP